MSIRAVEEWTIVPLQTFLTESQARLVLVMTKTGQVLAQYGFTRAMDVMSASALAAAIMVSTEEIAKLLEQDRFEMLAHSGKEQGIYLGRCDTPRGVLLILVVHDRETKLGLIKLFFEQLALDLGAAAPKVIDQRVEMAEDFERQLNESLTTLFGA